MILRSNTQTIIIFFRAEKENDKYTDDSNSYVMNLLSMAYQQKTTSGTILSNILLQLKK